MTYGKWMGTTAVVGALLVGGCTDRSDVQEQREDVAESRADLQQTRQEAQQDLQQEMAEARQETQEEIAGQREDVRQEEQELAEVQREQMEQEQGIGGAGSEAPLASSGTVTGKLDSTLGDNLKLIDNQNRTVELNTNESTQVTFNGQAAKLDDFEPGTEIRASYRTEGEEQVATSVQIVKPASEKVEHKPLE